MPTQSRKIKELRASPVIKPGTSSDNNMPPPRRSPRGSPKDNETSEDEKQYMMLRHSDDETNTSGSNSATDNNDGSKGGGSKKKQYEEVGHVPLKFTAAEIELAASRDEELQQRREVAHYIPKSPEQRVGKGSGSGGSITTARSMRGRGSFHTLSASAAAAAASASALTANKANAVHTPAAARQVSDFQGQKQPKSSVPFRGVHQDNNNTSPSTYLRGVSEDANSLEQPSTTTTTAAPAPPPPAVHNPHSPYTGPYYPPGASRDDLSLNLGMAPSWGSIDFRMGTFDYGDVSQVLGIQTNPTMELSVAASLAGYNIPNSSYEVKEEGGGEYIGGNVITPAQTVRKQHAAQASPQVVHQAFPPHQAYPPAQAQQVHHPYMYPPSSPIKAGPSPRGSPSSSPRVEDGEHNDDHTTRRTNDRGSEEELATEEWHRDNGKVVAATVHIPPSAGTAGMTARGGHTAAALATTTRHEDEIYIQPQFIRRAPSHGGPKSAPAFTSHPNPDHRGTATSSSSATYRPPLIRDTTRSETNDSSESPGHSLLKHGGRVQVVGGDNVWDGTSHPWSIVSRSRSAESHGSSGHYHHNEWDPPPRPNRTPMVPTPARPPSAAEYDRGGGNGMRPPPPPPPSYYHPGWDSYYRKGGPPPQPPIQRSSSSHSTGSGRVDYYQTVSSSPERPQPPPPSSASSYHPGYPHNHPGYPPRTGPATGGYSPYPPSSYPPYHQHPYYPSYPSRGPPPPPRGPPGEEDDHRHHDQDNAVEVAHPLLKDYNPHRDSMVVVRPQFQNVKKSRAASGNKRGGAAAVANTTRAAPPSSKNDATHVGPGGETPRRRRRRNPSEKAAAAAAMAAAAAAAMKEKREKEAKITAASAVKKEDGEKDGEVKEETKDSEAKVTIVGVLKGGTVTSPFSEEELKTLGSGDDEDIPAAKRAAMASALALRAAAGGSPVPPPKSASEVEFDIADPPMSPIIPPSLPHVPVLESATDMTENDVLCGRGGGTNSQMGNRHYRALVRDFQPTYLMAKRREKPKMARSVVLIVRHRGGRFLRRDETDGRLYEVGDEKAEAKTSQALREGLDVRATKTAANTLMGTAGGEVTSSIKKRKNSPTEQKPLQSMKSPRITQPVVHRAGSASRPSRPHPHPPSVAGYYPPPQYHPDPYYRSRGYPSTAYQYHPQYGAYPSHRSYPGAFSPPKHQDQHSIPISRPKVEEAAHWAK